MRVVNMCVLCFLWLLFKIIPLFGVCGDASHRRWQTVETDFLTWIWLTQLITEACLIISVPCQIGPRASHFNIGQYLSLFVGLNLNPVTQLFVICLDFHFLFLFTCFLCWHHVNKFCIYMNMCICCQIDENVFPYLFGLLNCPGVIS